MERVRIRYKPTSEQGVLQSAKLFSHPTNGAKFKVMLNLNSMEYVIVDSMADVVAASGEARTSALLKLSARNALSQLGVPLPKEERVKRAQHLE